MSDVSPDGDLWAVSFTATEGQDLGCAGLYDPDADKVVARSCDVYGLTFAPDGAHLLGGYYDNNMASDVSVLDRDLKQVGGFAPEGRTAAVSRAAPGTDPTAPAGERGGPGRADTWSLERVDRRGRRPPQDRRTGPAPGGPTRRCVRRGYRALGSGSSLRPGRW